MKKLYEVFQKDYADGWILTLSTDSHRIAGEWAGNLALQGFASAITVKEVE